MVMFSNSNIVPCSITRILIVIRIDVEPIRSASGSAKSGKLISELLTVIPPNAPLFMKSILGCGQEVVADIGQCL